MRAAKARKRLASPPEPEPKFKTVRYLHLSWAVRDDLSGHVEWMPLTSVRDMTRRISVLARHYQPGPAARSK